MSRSEQQTRFELIDPALLERGWRREDIRVEETAAAIDIVSGQGRRRPTGRTDYVLRRPLEAGGEPLPLAILEAKRESLPPEHGLQQGKDYRVGHLHHVPFVFASNGHQFVLYDEASGQVSESKPMHEFPGPEALIARLLEARGLQAENPMLRFFNAPYARGRDQLRYYQDAAIRAAMESVARHRAAGTPPRALLSLATGAGKTRIAAALLKRMFDAGLMGRALFVCDRTELRDNGLGDFQVAFGSDAAEVDGRNPQKNARVLIATYQTLDGGETDEEPAFFLRHYPAGFFDVIVIDECHRSAWGAWNAILSHHPEAIQIGLTATPRQIRLPETRDGEVLDTVKREQQLLADNHLHFGPPAYTYSYLQGVADGYLAPAELETYDLYHERHEQPERVRGVRRDDVRDKQITELTTGRTLPAEAVPVVNEGTALDARLIMPDRVSAMCEHLFDRLLAVGEGTPLQKTIVFCASDHHADLVANALNNRYNRWCADQKQKRVQTFAFKCMSSSNGQALIPDFRGRKRSHFVATTKDLLTTGVNVPCVRNIVFFRYVSSPILFHQMVGRGTRVDEESGKLMFRIFDYTGATALFGADFISPPPSPPGSDGPQGPEPPPPIKVKGVRVHIENSGSFNLLGRDGRLARVTPEEYRQRLVQELTASVPALADFRARWLDPEARRELFQQLAAQNLLPERIREATHMEAYDLFDVMAAVAYGVEPLTRAERAARLDREQPEWLIRLPQPSARIIRAIIRQFERAGTEGLEAGELWQTPEIRELQGLKALGEGGDPRELLQKLKRDLFVA